MNLQYEHLTEERIRSLILPAIGGVGALIYWMLVTRPGCFFRGHDYCWTCDTWEGDHLSMIWWQCTRCQRGTWACVPAYKED